MRKNIVLFFVFTLLWIHRGASQTPGAQLFDNAIIHEIRFSSNYQSLVDTLTKNYVLSFGMGQIQIRKIPYSPASITIDGTTLADSAGVRYKGFNSWWSSEKKPIKVDLNRYEDQTYDGLTKFNLHNGSGDPSFIRENISYHMLRSFGIKAPRTSYAKVYLDDSYLGLFRVVEQVDNVFLDVNFGGHEGNLYVQQSSGTGGYGLDWISNQQEDYYPHLELENHQKANDWSSLIHFLDVLNHSADENFKQEIESVFDVEEFLKVLAFDIAMNNIDCYGNSGRNYYLAEVNGKFRWIPWDYNLTVRDDGAPIDINPDDHPVLINRILKEPAFHDRFLRKYCEWLPRFSHIPFDALVDDEAARIDALMKIDPVMDYPYEAFQTNQSVSWDNIPGLKQFAAKRHADILETLVAKNFDCSVTGVEEAFGDGLQLYPIPAKDFLQVRSLSSKTTSVTIHNLLGQPVIKTEPDEEGSIDVRQLQPGHYILRGYVGGKVYSRLVLVKR